MSGGSYGYAFHHVEDVADRLRESEDPLRRAFAKHLDLVARAMHDVEWVDSHDYGPGDDENALRGALGESPQPGTPEAICEACRLICGEAPDWLEDIGEWSSPDAPQDAAERRWLSEALAALVAWLDATVEGPVR
jgi:hypothetical protein